MKRSATRKREKVVRDLLSLDPMKVSDPIPTRIASRLASLGGWAGLLRRSEQDLLGVRELGHASLEDYRRWMFRVTASLGCGLELEEVRSIIEALRLQDMEEVGDPPIAKAVEDSEDSIPCMVRSQPRCIQALCCVDVPGLQLCTRRLLSRKGVAALGELSSYTDKEISAWRGMGERVRENLRSVILDLRDIFESTGGNRSMSVLAFRRAVYFDAPLFEKMGKAVLRMTKREQRILWSRSLNPKPLSLDALGKEMGISHGRVRQVESRARTRLREEEALGRMIDLCLSTHRSGRRLPLTLARLCKQDPWFSGPQAAPQRLAVLLRALDCEHQAVEVPGLTDPIVVPSGVVHVFALIRDLRARLSAPGDAKFLQASAARLLAGIQAPELLSLSLDRTQIRLHDPRTMDSSASPVRQHVEAVLQETSEPMTVSEIRARMLKKGINIKERSIRRCFERQRIDVVRTGLSTYVLKSEMEVYDRYYEEVTRDVEALLKTDASARWRTGRILKDLYTKGVQWTFELPPAALDYLLSEHPSFHMVSLGIWRLVAYETQG